MNKNEIVRQWLSQFITLPILTDWSIVEKIAFKHNGFLKGGIVGHNRFSFSVWDILEGSEKTKKKIKKTIDGLLKLYPDFENPIVVVCYFNNNMIPTIADIKPEALKTYQKFIKKYQS